MIVISKLAEELLIKTRIFVYGTLRKGMYNYDLYLKKHNTYVEDAYIKGTLHTIQGCKYPALIDGEHLVLGEIHEVNNDALKAVDDMEHYYGVDHPDNEYNKIMCDIFDKNGEFIEQLPTYIYNMTNSKYAKLIGEVIEVNDYVKFIENN